MTKKLDPKKWVDRLLYINETSDFTASEKAVIEKRLKALLEELGHPIPFVEEGKK